MLPLGALFGFGVLIPLRHGFDFLDARMILAYAFIPMLFVASPVAFGLASARGSYRSLLTWIAAATCFGWCVGILFLSTGLATLNYVAQPAPLQLPPAKLLVTYAAFCLATVWFISASAAFLAILFSPKWAQQILRIGFLLVLSFFYVGPQALPASVQMDLSQANHQTMAWWFSVILLLAAAGLTWALRAAPPVRVQHIAAESSTQSSSPL